VDAGKDTWCGVDAISPRDQRPPRTFCRKGPGVSKGANQIFASIPLRPAS